MEVVFCESCCWWVREELNWPGLAFLCLCGGWNCHSGVRLTGRGELAVMTFRVLPRFGPDQENPPWRLSINVCKSLLLVKLR